MEPFDFHDNDTTEQIVCKPFPTGGVSFLDPDHTVYQPLDGTVAMKAPRKPRGLMSKVIAGLFVFDVLLAGYAVVALARQQPVRPSYGVSVGSVPETLDTVSTSSTTSTSLPKTTTVTTVATTLKPATTQAAPRATVCLP